jgi:cyclic pyranopterin phosphate synthase
LRQLLRDPAQSDTTLAATVDAIWRGRTDQYSVLRSLRGPDTASGPGRRVEMSYIGG